MQEHGEGDGYDNGLSIAPCCPTQGNNCRVLAGLLLLCS